MERYGLTSYRTNELAKLSAEIVRDPIAIAVCRIMNDFRPVEQIIDSLIRDADNERLQRYFGTALASYCYRPGLPYSILSAAFEPCDLKPQFRDRDMLPLSFSDFDTKDYVIPTNPVLGQRILREIARKEPGLMFEVYSTVGIYIAPYVNRKAILKRTPEARLSARLLDYDGGVEEFISSQSEAFYIRVKRYWDWNSRYWEQFSLLKLDHFLKSTMADRFDLLSHHFRTPDTP